MTLSLYHMICDRGVLSTRPRRQYKRSTFNVQASINSYESAAELEAFYAFSSPRTIVSPKGRIAVYKIGARCRSHQTGECLLCFILHEPNLLVSTPGVTLSNLSA